MSDGGQSCILWLSLRRKLFLSKPPAARMTRPSMDEPETRSNILPAEKMRDLKARLDELNHERICLRITDKYWNTLKERARKSPKPLDVALQSELNRAANAICRHYRTFVIRKP